MTACLKCSEPALTFPSGKSARLCTEHAWEMLSRIPNPDCEHCHGEGDFPTHSIDCENDLCVMAAGPHDCAGQVLECDCSIFDGIE